jgi:hypothetical protein
MSGITHAPLPPPSAGEGTLRSRRGEGRRDALGFGSRRDLSGSGAPPLWDFVPTRPLLTQGPSSPAEGEGIWPSRKSENNV